MDALLTLDQTAERLHVSTETLRKLYRREGLPVIRLSRNRYLVSEEALAEWLRSRTMRSGWGTGGESGAPAPSTESANTGASLSAWAATPVDVAASSGSSRPRRGPRRTYAASNPASVVAFRRRKAT